EQQALIPLARGNRLAGLASLENPVGCREIQIGLANLVAMTLRTFRLNKGPNVAFAGGGLGSRTQRTARAKSHQAGGKENRKRRGRRRHTLSIRSSFIGGGSGTNFCG